MPTLYSREVDAFWKTILWQQLGAAIDMLENAMRACPDEVWSDPAETPRWAEREVVGFWYVAYHTLFFLDFYFSDAAEDFAPPPPFTLAELDPACVLPERAYSKPELLNYLDYCRAKSVAFVDALTEEKAREARRILSFEGSAAELVVQQLRHVQHHTAQLNLLLRQKTGSAPSWVRKAQSAGMSTHG